jgi:hypothetical protein
MTAKLMSTNTSVVTGGPVAKINATITNENAGTIRISSSNFLLEDSNTSVHKPVSASAGMSSTDVVVDNGEGAWMQMNFYIDAGSHPTELTYFDGTNKVVSPVS